jgi:hypothetical protein
MADPKRLAASASGIHRTLLSAGERSFEPPAGAFDAVWGGVAAKMLPGAASALNGSASAGTSGTATAGAAATGGATATGGAGWVAKLGGPALAKWALVIVATVGATAGVVVLARSAASGGDAERAPAVVLPPTDRLTPPEPTEAPPAPTTRLRADVPSPPAVPAPTATVTDPFHGGIATSRPRPSTLPEETATIIRAREDIQRGAPAEALRVLDTFEREHRGGLLGEERELLRVRALAALGDPRAKTRAAAFVARHPQSSYAERFRPFTE